MRFSRRFGLVLAATVLSFTTAATGAVADPTGTTAGTTPETTGTTPPEEAAPDAKSVQGLTMTAAFDKTSYTTGETMAITVTVTNTGSEPVTTQVMFGQPNPDTIVVTETSPVGQGQAFTVAAGASTTLAVAGGMGNPDVTTATLYAALGDGSTPDESFAFTVPVTPTYGHASGVVYYDRNRNRRFDEGEGQRGVKLTWLNGLQYEAVRTTVTTDEKGEFSLTDLPTGPYDVTGEGLGGLQVGLRRVTVSESGVDGLQFRGTAPLHGLFAKVEFTKDSYAPDESPTVRVTLSNSSDMAISGLIATCVRPDDDTGFTGGGAGWGDLVGDGVDLAPHSTMTFDVTEPMPPGAYNLGFVSVGCEFRYPDIQSVHNPLSYDHAAVPGLLGDARGVVTHDGAGLAGVRVLLVPDYLNMPGAPCAIVAETTTGPDGTFAFQQVPVGLYVLYMDPPRGWRIEETTFGMTNVYGDRVAEMSFTALPGDHVPMVLPECVAGDTGPTTPTPVPTGPATPAPQARGTTGLADTGANVVAPGIAGLLAVFAGTAMVLVSRRRRPTGEN